MSLEPYALHPTRSRFVSYFAHPTRSSARWPSPVQSLAPVPTPAPERVVISYDRRLVKPTLKNPLTNWQLELTTELADSASSTKRRERAGTAWQGKARSVDARSRANQAATSPCSQPRPFPALPTCC